MILLLAIIGLAILLGHFLPLRWGVWGLLGAVAIFSFSLGILATVSFCNWKALLPGNFGKYGLCAATDPPSDVFISFLMMGCILSVATISLFGFRRWMSK